MNSWSGVSPPSSVTVYEPDNPEVGRILKPDGSVAKIVRAKPQEPAGFKPEERSHA